MFQGVNSSCYSEVEPLCLCIVVRPAVGRLTVVLALQSDTWNRCCYSYCYCCLTHVASTCHISSCVAQLYPCTRLLVAQDLCSQWTLCGESNSIQRLIDAVVALPHLRRELRQLNLLLNWRDPRGTLVAVDSYF